IRSPSTTTATPWRGASPVPSNNAAPLRITRSPMALPLLSRAYSSRLEGAAAHRDRPPVLADHLDVGQGERAARPDRPARGGERSRGRRPQIADPQVDRRHVVAHRRDHREVPRRVDERRDRAPVHVLTELIVTSQEILPKRHADDDLAGQRADHLEPQQPVIGRPAQHLGERLQRQVDHYWPPFSTPTCSLARALSAVRSNLPVLPSGAAAMNSTARGCAYAGPRARKNCFNSSSETVRPAWRTTNATGASPFTACATGTTNASRTAGCSSSVSSTSFGYTFSPPTLIMSSRRPRM